MFLHCDKEMQVTLEVHHLEWPSPVPKKHCRECAQTWGTFTASHLGAKPRRRPRWGWSVRPKWQRVQHVMITHPRLVRLSALGDHRTSLLTHQGQVDTFSRRFHRLHFYTVWRPRCSPCRNGETEVQREEASCAKLPDSNRWCLSSSAPTPRHSHTLTLTHTFAHS